MSKELAEQLLNAWHNHTGAEPSESVLARVIEVVAEALQSTTPVNKELADIHAVVLDFGGDWPEVEGDPYTLYHVKRFSRERRLMIGLSTPTLKIDNVEDLQCLAKNLKPGDRFYTDTEDEIARHVPCVVVLGNSVNVCVHPNCDPNVTTWIAPETKVTRIHSIE